MDAGGVVGRGEHQRLDGVFWLVREEERGYVCGWKAACRLGRVNETGAKAQSVPWAPNSMDELSDGWPLAMIIVYFFGSPQTIKIKLVDGGWFPVMRH